MRCLSIARAIKETVLFITADNCLKNAILYAEVNHFILNSDYQNLDQELGQMQDLLKKNRPSALFVDSYYVTKSYLQTLWGLCSSIGCKLVYLDDILAFAYPCDILINYNLYGLDVGKKYRLIYNDGIVPRLLLGTDYVPLRGEFNNMASRVVREKGRDILISTGGADQEHIALSLVQAIIKRGGSEFCFHFVIGTMNTDIEEIKQNSSDNIILHQNVVNMAELMRQCDVAISAAGSTLYELCATQTPAVTYILADNQILGAEGFKQYGVMNCCGDYRECGNQLAERLLDSAIELANDYEARKAIARKMETVVDGNGAKRIVCAI